MEGVGTGGDWWRGDWGGLALGSVPSVVFIPLSPCHHLKASGSSDLW